MIQSKKRDNCILIDLLEVRISRYIDILFFKLFKRCEKPNNIKYYICIKYGYNNIYYKLITNFFLYRQKSIGDTGQIFNLSFMAYKEGSVAI